jgi:hypothetical protein
MTPLEIRKTDSRRSQPDGSLLFVNWRPYSFSRLGALGYYLILRFAARPVGKRNVELLHGVVAGAVLRIARVEKGGALDLLEFDEVKK